MITKTNTFSNVQKYGRQDRRRSLTWPLAISSTSFHEATDRRRMAWHGRHTRDGRGTSHGRTRAVEKGWKYVRLTNNGHVKEQSGCLTDEGRAVARKGTLG